VSDDENLLGRKGAQVFASCSAGNLEEGTVLTLLELNDSDTTRHIDDQYPASG
jgi:hypothetical protein